jgi:G3E family GTPase
VSNGEWFKHLYDNGVNTDSHNQSIRTYAYESDIEWNWHELYKALNNIKESANMDRLKGVTEWAIILWICY